jgi:antitoxin (DNA-binding transcriptional repressor) of toxin-antitoxin stability system
MSTATVQQIGQDLASWLGFVRRGETVAITDHGRVIARLMPPDVSSLGESAGSRTMADWLAEQDGRMQRIFGSRILADSAAVLDDLRSDRE